MKAKDAAQVVLIAGGLLLGMIGGGIVALMALAYLWPLIVNLAFAGLIILLGMFTIAILHSIFEGE